MKRIARTTLVPMLLALGLAAGLGQAAGGIAMAQADPASVYMAFEKTVGVDVDAGLALVTDNAVLRITPPPQGTTGLWTGKAQVREALQYSKDHQVKREVTGTPQVTGDRVTATTMVSNDVFQRLGVAPVQFSTEAVVESGKIASFVTTIAPSEQARVAAAAQAAQAAQPQGDPASVYMAFARGVGSADIEATLAMVTDDAVLRITPPPPGTPGLWTGKAEIRQALEYARDHGVKHEFAAAPQVSGNKVTATVMLTNSFFQDWGVAPVQFASEATIEGGKVKSFSNIIVPSEQARVVAAAQAFQAAHAAQPPAGMPRTGAGEVTTITLLVLLCLLLVTAGGMIRRRGRI